MRGHGTTLFLGLRAASGPQALRPQPMFGCLSVGSVQIAAKALAADFNRETGNKVTLTIVTPSTIPQKLASGRYDMIICSIPAMDVLDKAGSLRPGSRSPLSRVGIGVMVREGAPIARRVHARRV